jgi:predicted Zn-dependent protease with MMP-like domain
MTFDDAGIRDATAKVGLHHGRMISGSKSGYRRAYPDHVVVFNAALADADGRDPLEGRSRPDSGRTQAHRTCS